MKSETVKGIPPESLGGIVDSYQKDGAVNIICVLCQGEWTITVYFE